MLPNLSHGQPTYSVAELCGEVRGLLRALPGVWVAGEVQRLRRSRRGHLYFEMVEKGADDAVVGKLESVVWRRDLTRIEGRLAASDQRIAEGMEIRCGVEVDFYAPFGRLQLVVRDIDPVFTLGRLNLRRREVLRALTEDGLVDRNRQRGLSEVPLDVALVTSEGSAAYHDFLAALTASGLGFRVVALHAAVQGREAEREVAAALAAVRGLAVDCVVLTRGGGARTDLAAFDSRRVAEAIARTPVPVITGLGHEIDESIADLVAHTRATTPTQAGELLVRRVRDAEARLDRLARRLGAEGRRQIDGAGGRLGRIEREMSLAGIRLAEEKERLGAMGSRLGRAARRRVDSERRWRARLQVRLAVTAPRAVDAGRRGIADLAVRTAERSSWRLREADVRLRGLERLCRQLGPTRTLARGFSITRDARGRVVTDASKIEVGARITSELAVGRLTSRVEDGGR